MRKKLVPLLTLLLLVFAAALNVHAATGVAKIGTKTYDTLPKAFSEVKNGQTITLTKNVSISGNLKVSLGSKSVVLNLNNKNLKVSKTFTLAKGSLTLANNGTLTAKDIKNAGSLTLQQANIKGSVSNTGSFTMLGGTLTGTSGRDYTIMTDSGVVSISAGSIQYQGPYDFENFSNDRGPELNNGSAILVKGKSHVVIKGGEINSTSEILMTDDESDSVIYIKNGTFTSDCFGMFALCGWDSVLITGGNYNIHGCWGVVYVFGPSQLVIKGGDFVGEWSFFETYSPDSSIVITGGRFTSYMTLPGAAMLLSFNGTILASNCSFLSTDDPYLMWKSPDSEEAVIRISNSVAYSTSNILKETADPCE